MWSKLHQRPFLRSRLDPEGHSTGSVGAIDPPRPVDPRASPVSLVEEKRRGGRRVDNSRRTAGERGCHTSTAQHKAPEDEQSGGNGSETGQLSIRACRLWNPRPKLRLESCQGSRTAPGMTETSTNAAMNWYHQPRLRNQGPNCRKAGLCRRGV